ncbi:LOW QUALITY PROTEIN: hypothetical protein V2J09_005410 [Rumex salicifolius]
MAEAAVFGIASVTLATIASPAVRSAYEKAVSVRKAQADLDKLKRSIKTIQAVLLDAEKKQDSSAAIRDWIKRVRDVLYDADDLFDEVATDDMLRKQIKENKLKKEVCSCFTSSSLNPFTSSRNSVVAKKVKDIRKSLDEISEDMKAFQFAECRNERPIGGIRKGQDSGLLFLESEKVIGRDKEKKAIIEMLVAGSSSNVSVIAIVGIGGIGKTTLAHLVYNDSDTRKIFGKNRWFVSISDTSNDKEIIEKIYHSTYGGRYKGLSIIDLQNRIREKIKGKPFLLVLDDVWDHDRARWTDRMGLLSEGGKGSKVIVTTRSESVARAVGAEAMATHHLDGLSEEDSWDLIVGFTQEQERDSTWANLGRQIVKKCANVPLAVKSIASLLFEKKTIREWESFKNEELSNLGQDHEDGIMPVLRLSYEHLSSNLKHCFAYCSLFPKNYEFDKDVLIYLWISQGYIEAKSDKQNIEDIDDSWTDLHPLLNVNRLRSFLYQEGYSSSCKLTLEKQFANFKCLRALSLISLDIETIPSSIGDLKHLRYLDISGNAFRTLPDAFTKLVNMWTLNIRCCQKLEALPNQFRKLTNLRGLLNRDCDTLMQIPPGFEELTSLQTLDEFRVSKEIDGGQRSKLDVLCRLKLRGELRISFREETDDWDGVECWKPSPFLQGLWIDDYKGNRIPHWGNKMTDNQASLTTLSLIGCSRVKCLPSFRHLPNVNDLTLIRMYELVYIEGGEEEEENQDPNAIFIPNLKKIYFDILPKLKGWSRNVEVAARSKEVNVAARASTSTCPPPPPLQVLSFPSLYAVSIMNCQELSHMLPCPSLQKLTLISVKANLICQFLQPINITPLSSLQFVRIKLCDDLVSFPGESLTSLEHLYIDNCSKLKQVHLAPLHLNILEDLILTKCPELELWEENERGVQWDSLPKLTELELMEIPSSESLPDCLRLRQELGILKIHVSIFSTNFNVIHKKSSSRLIFT